MRYLFLILGVIFLLSSTYSLAMYLLDYDVLSHYGKGYVWGKILILIVGIVLLSLGIRLMRKR